MKKILKYGSLIIVAMTTLLFASPLSAGNTQAFPESKFVDRFSSEDLRANGNITPGGSDERPGPQDAINKAPIGDAIGWVTALALAYGVYILGKKRKNENSAW
ncbi:MAG: hypothetical protein LBH61_00535 [Dysgonamonadaceae bacterium]|jgi:hypothetical protein|nr:hypothetical protein [Dysgonamonadaceae bacterium]